MSFNVETFIRVRPIPEELEKKEPFLTIDEKAKIISIFNPSDKKENPERNIYTYQDIITSSDQNDFRNISCGGVIDNLINGVNVGIFFYGASNSGKTYSTFGDISKPIDKYNETRGLTFRLCSDLLKSLTKSKNIFLSIYEIHLERLVDLLKEIPESLPPNIISPKSPTKPLISNAKFMKKQQTYQETSPAQSEQPNPELIEKNGKMLIKNITIQKIESESELYNLLEKAINNIKKLSEKESMKDRRTHTIIQFKFQSPSEPEDSIIANYLYIIDLAGCEKISKALSENQKYFEAHNINNSLETLSKCLITLSVSEDGDALIPYRDSKLTKVLKNILNSRSQILMIGHIYPLESYYKECVQTLQYIERCKSKPINREKTIDFSKTNTLEKMIKKLREENTEYKSEIERENQFFKKKLEFIKSLFGYKGDMDLIITKRMTTNDLSVLRSHKENVERLKNLQKDNAILEKKLKDLEKSCKSLTEKQDEIIKYYHESFEKKKALLNSINSKNEILKVELDQAQKKKEKEVNDEVFKLKDQANILFAEKAGLLLKVNDLMNEKTESLNKVKEMKILGAKEAIHIFKKDIDKCLEENQNEIKEVEEKFKGDISLVSTKAEEEIKQIENQCQKKRNNLKDLKEEQIELYNFVFNQYQFIEKVENGKYSKGIKSFNIPRFDKVNYSLRDYFKYTNKLITNKKVISFYDSKKQ